MVKSTLKQAYQSENLQIFPAGTTTRVRASGNLDFARINSQLSGVRRSVNDWYSGKTGRQMDTYDLGDMVDDVRARFYSDPRFRSTCSQLDISADNISKIYLPWWNEFTAGEKSYRLDPSENAVDIEVSPMHSFQTQLMRQGLFDGALATGLKPISIDGLFITSPDEGSETGYIVLEVRGGASYPNTFHVAGSGSLKYSASLTNGTSSISDIWFQDELVPELGSIQGSELSSLSLHARTQDYLLNHGAPTYVTKAVTSLTKDEVLKRWAKNGDEDQAEFRRLLFLPANPESVNQFIATHYKGKAKNDFNRPETQAVLLPPAALDLASFSGMNLETLSQYYTEGEH